MPRPISAPSLPFTPGGWLACYRYRLSAVEEQLYSPEQLAPELGVSGDTVRRWEAGRATPTPTDLQRFASVCRLSAIEKTFLFHAYSPRHEEEPPDATFFRDRAGSLLLSECPAFIFDSLFHVRAWNSFMDLVQTRSFRLTGDHIIERILEPDFTYYLVGGNRRLERWLREFWFRTAQLCGSREYVEVIERLAKNPEFARRWLQLGFEFHDAEGEPIGAPTYLGLTETGRFRIATSLVALPPNYFLREYIPADSLALQKIERRKEQGPPTISILDRIHWLE